MIYASNDYLAGGGLHHFGIAARDRSDDAELLFLLGPVCGSALVSECPHAGEPAKYKVERWDGKDSHVEEIVASASLVMIGQAAFYAAIEQ